jgi:hypothetical protein
VDTPTYGARLFAFHANRERLALALLEAVEAEAVLPPYGPSTRLSAAARAYREALKSPDL